jgi:hypothetical protein
MKRLFLCEYDKDEIIVIIKIIINIPSCHELASDRRGARRMRAGWLMTT